MGFAEREHDRFAARSQFLEHARHTFGRQRILLTRQRKCFFDIAQLQLRAGRLG
ncbi:hypothetical protein D3C87_1069940 [compost metagenome]